MLLRNRDKSGRKVLCNTIFTLNLKTWSLALSVTLLAAEGNQNLKALNTVGVVSLMVPI